MPPGRRAARRRRRPAPRRVGGDARRLVARVVAALVRHDHPEPGARPAGPDLPAASRTRTPGSRAGARRAGPCGPGFDDVEAEPVRGTKRSVAPGRGATGSRLARRPAAGAATLPHEKAALAILLAVLSVPAVSGAGELELTGYGGYTFPFYNQTFKYDPGPVSVPIPGVTVEQGGSFELKASGGPAFAGGLAFYVTDGVRLRAALRPRRHHGRDAGRRPTTSRSAFPRRSTRCWPSLTLAEGTADLKAAAPLVAQPQAPHGRAASSSPPPGGASRLGDLEFTAAADDRPRRRRPSTSSRAHIQVGTVGVKATGVAGESSWGGNLGLGIQIPLGEHGGLVLEGAGLLLPEADRRVGAGPRPAAHRDRAGAARARCRSASRRSSSSRGGCRPRWGSRSASDPPASRVSLTPVPPGTRLRREGTGSMAEEGTSTGACRSASTTCRSATRRRSRASSCGS